VSHELDLYIPIIKREKKSGDHYESVIILFEFNKKIYFTSYGVLFGYLLGSHLGRIRPVSAPRCQIWFSPVRFCFSQARVFFLLLRLSRALLVFGLCSRFSSGHCATLENSFGKVVQCCAILLLRLSHALLVFGLCSRFFVRSLCRARKSLR
jgi:hypothetical protein